MPKGKLTYSISLEKVNNEILSIRQIYNPSSKKQELVLHSNNESIPNKVGSWDELFNVMKEDAMLRSILGEYEG